MLKDGYIRYSRDLPEPNYSNYSSIWQEFTKSPITLSIQPLFQDIKTFFDSNPQGFITIIKKAHHIEARIPDNFDKLPILDRCNIFFAYFRYIFKFDELDVYVNQTNFNPDNMKKYFSSETFTLFESICILFKTLITNLPPGDYEKYCSPLSFTFAKLLIPDGYRHLSSESFHLDHIFIAPVLLTSETLQGQPAFLSIDENGGILIVDAANNSELAKFPRFGLTGMIDNNKLLFYGNSIQPVYDLQFTNSEAASNAFIFSMTPPHRGFMQLSAFLSSLSNFADFSTFFPSNLATLPPDFIEGIQKCLSTSTFEVLLYSFIAPTNESTIDEKTFEFFLNAIGDKFLPFYRALTHLSWSMAPFGGQLIMRGNNQFSLLCRLFLKIFGSEYSRFINSEMRKIIESQATRIKAYPFDAEDAQIFVNDIFLPIIDVLSESIPKMPTSIRTLLKELFIRTAGFYINQSAPWLVMPNLMLLRYIIPPFSTETVIAYKGDQKLTKIASLAANSLLSLFYENGWQEDKDPELAKLNGKMKELYPKMAKFTHEVIDVDTFDYDLGILDKKKTQGDVLKLLDTAAKRVILMNMNEPNKIIHSHPYSVSIMEMIEVFIYDFSKGKL